MQYDEILKIVVDSVDHLITEIDNEVRAEFECFSEWLDLFIDSLRSFDREDYLLLISQMTQLTGELKYANECTCTEHARWHSCLSRLYEAFRCSAIECNTTMLKRVCEIKGIPYESIHIVESKKPIPEDGIDFTVPDVLPENWKIDD